MTPEEAEETIEAASTRLGILFSKCPKNDAGHTWSSKVGACRWCGQIWPYGRAQLTLYEFQKARLAKEQEGK
jgi:hypothetical protein